MFQVTVVVIDTTNIIAKLRSHKIHPTREYIHLSQLVVGS